MSEWTQRVAVQVLIPDPTTIGFRLDAHALDGPIGLRGPGNAVVLGKTALDVARLSPLATPEVWWDMTPWAVQIDTMHGNRADDVTMPPEVGTCAVTLRNAPDLPALGIRYGTNLRVVLKPPPESENPWPAPVWFGAVDDVVDDLDRPDDNADQWTTVAASDDIRDYSTTTRYGITADYGDAGDTFGAVLSQTAPKSVMRTAGMEGRYPIVACKTEKSLASTLTMLATTGRFVWTLRPDIMSPPTVLTRDPRNIPATPHHFSDLPGDPASFYRIRRESGTAQVLTSIELTNNSVGTDGGQVSTSATYADPGLVAAYGPRTTSADVCAPAEHLPQIADWLRSTMRTPATTVTSLTIDGAPPDLPDDGDGERVIHPLDPIVVRVRGRTHALLVASVAHTITPHRWRTTLTTVRSLNA